VQLWQISHDNPTRDGALGRFCGVTRGSEAYYYYYYYYYYTTKFH